MWVVMCTLFMENSAGFHGLTWIKNTAVIVLTRRSLQQKLQPSAARLVSRFVSVKTKYIVMILHPAPNLEL